VTTIEHAVAREAALDSARGWVIVTLGVCMLTLIWGIVFTFTVYADRLAATFGLTAVQVSSVFSTTSAALLAIGGLFGVFAARVTLRPVLALVAAGLAVSIALLQIADSFAGVVPRVRGAPERPAERPSRSSSRSRHSGSTSTRASR